MSELKCAEVCVYRKLHVRPGYKGSCGWLASQFSWRPKVGGPCFYCGRPIQVEDKEDG